MATLKEIAAKANVHLTTVSSILNQSKGNSRCSEATRKKVLEVAQKMGYVRNQLANRLRSRRNNTVCLIAGDIRNPFFAALATAIEEELDKRDYQLLLLCRGLDDDRHDPSLAQTIFEQPVDGFIVWSESASKTLQQLPARFPKPIVTVGARVDGFPGVQLDIGSGLKMAVDHLIRKGHRHLAYYAPEESRLKGLPQPRPQIFEKIVADCGLPSPQLIFYPGHDWDVAAACEFAEKAKLDNNITAVIGFNDVSVLGWQKSSRAKKIEAVGFDGTDWLWLGTRPIACVRIPVSELARTSVSMIFAHIDGLTKKKASPVVVLPEFVES